MKTKYVGFILVGGGHSHVLTCTYTRFSQLYLAVNSFADGMNNATYCALQSLARETTGQSNLLAFTKFLDKNHAKPITK